MMEHQAPAIFVALEQSAFAAAIRQSIWLYPLANVGHIVALACFAGRGAVSVRELVEATAQRPSTLTGVLDRLEGRGLVERAANPKDRRSVLVRLTPDGRAHAARVAEAYEELERRLPAAELRRVLEEVS